MCLEPDFRLNNFDMDLTELATQQSAPLAPLEVYEIEASSSHNHNGSHAEPEASPIAGNTFEKTQQLLASHQNLPNPTEKLSTRPHLAYDRLQPIMLSKSLSSDDEETILAALSSSCALLGQHQKAQQFVEEGLLEVFGTLASPSSSFSSTVRQLALRCIEKILTSPHVSRSSTLLTESVHSAIQSAMDNSTNAEFRSIAYLSLLHCSDAVESVRAIVSLNLVSRLLHRLNEELIGYTSFSRGEELTNVILLTLRKLFSQTSQTKSCDQALERLDTISIFFDCVTINHATDETKALALGCLLFLAGEVDGKTAIIKEGDNALSILLSSCRSSSASVCAGAAGTLCGILVHDDGKRALLSSSDWPALVELVNLKNSSSILLPACTALGAFSAHPTGRALLLERLPHGRGESAKERLEKILDTHKEGPVFKAASRALATIVWVPV